MGIRTFLAWQRLAVERQFSRMREKKRADWKAGAASAVYGGGGS